MTPSDADLQAGVGEDNWVTTWAQSGGGHGTGLAALLEADVLMLGDTEKVALQLWAEDNKDVVKVTDLYQPLFECVTTRRNQLYQVSKQEEDNQDDFKQSGSHVDPTSEALSMPSLAVTVFLREEPMAGEDVGAQLKDHLASSAWKFHHSEGVSRGKLMLYENNSQDYLTARPHLPLCALRQIHCGKRLLRFLRFASSDNWRDNVNLYSLLMAKDPDILKADFCLFTASYHTDYEVQLALKKIPKGIKCKPVPGAALCFRISQLGHTVPLLPNVCIPVTSDRWKTTDLDDNIIYLDVVRMRDRSCEPVPDLIESALSQLMSADDRQTKSASNSSKKFSPSKPVHKTLLHQKSKSESSLFVPGLPAAVPEPSEYDSVDDVELLISDALSDDSEGSMDNVLQGEITQHNSVNVPEHEESVNISENEDIVKVSERDACGAVDGSSYHSEGNHEDQLSSSGLGSSVPIQTEESKMSSSARTVTSRTEVVTTHRNPPVKQWASEQKLRTKAKTFSELDFWASQSESGSPQRNRVDKSRVVLSSGRPTQEVVVGQPVRPPPSYPGSAATGGPTPQRSSRPQLPTYSELENRKKNHLNHSPGQILSSPGTPGGGGKQGLQVGPVTHTPPHVTGPRQPPSGQQSKLPPPPYRSNPSGPPPPNTHTTPSQRQSDSCENSQRFRFNGTTVPRFGRNAKWRQSVLPPPPSQSSYGMTQGYDEQRGNRTLYEEQAVDVPGASAAYSQDTTQGSSATLGFYV